MQIGFAGDRGFGSGGRRQPLPSNLSISQRMFTSVRQKRSVSDFGLDAKGPALSRIDDHRMGTK